MRMARSRPSCAQRPRVGRHEGRGQGALREEVAQEVRDAEGGLEGVAHSARRPRSAAKTCSRTRPSRRDRNVRAETSPAARSERPTRPIGLASADFAAQLR